jgi:uncharacterized small protein (DUF1192 family)
VPRPFGHPERSAAKSKDLRFDIFTVCAAAPLANLVFSAVAIAQTPDASQPPSYANYSLMLVNPAPGGGAVVVMHNPKNELEFVPVTTTKQALDAGYVAVRAAELGEFIAALKEENARLAAENARLRNNQPTQASAPTPLPPTRFEIEAQQRAEKAARRQQLIQTWLMLQNVNRPQTFNVNVTDCTRSPALCVGR